MTLYCSFSANKSHFSHSSTLSAYSVNAYSIIHTLSIINHIHDVLIGAAMNMMKV